jgi:pimeloyl-ACP methyl ester carboxylesterase
MTFRSRIAAPAAVLALVAALLAALFGGRTSAGLPAASGATAAAPAAVPAVAKTRPTIVLVHGAWADANGFDTEIATLGALGYPVVTIANPLRGLTSDADYVRARLATIPGPVVLVGHSYGGAVITNAARGASNVKALVYLAAFGLAEGESLATALPADVYPGSHLDGSKLDVVPVANAVAPGGQDADLYIKPAEFADIFAGDVPKAKAALQAATQRPLSAFAFTEPSGAPAWASNPSWYLVASNDHAISPAGQRFMAARMHAHTETVASAHDVMISHPLQVDKIILEAALSVR